MRWRDLVSDLNKETREKRWSVNKRKVVERDDRPVNTLFSEPDGAVVPNWEKMLSSPIQEKNFDSKYLTRRTYKHLLSTGNRGVGLSKVRDAHFALAHLVYSGSMLYKVAGQHSLSCPPSFLFSYLERLVKEVLFIYLSNSYLSTVIVWVGHQKTNEMCTIG